MDVCYTASMPHKNKNMELFEREIRDFRAKLIKRQRAIII